METQSWPQERVVSLELLQSQHLPGVHATVCFVPAIVGVLGDANLLGRFPHGMNPADQSIRLTKPVDNGFRRCSPLLHCAHLHDGMILARILGRCLGGRPIAHDFRDSDRLTTYHGQSRLHQGPALHERAYRG